MAAEAFTYNCRILGSYRKSYLFFMWANAQPFMQNCRNCKKLCELKS